MITNGPKAGFWKSMIWLLPPLLLALAAVTWFEFDRGSRLEQSPSQLAADAPKGKFERRIHDYLLEHPEVVMEAASFSSDDYE